MNAPLHVLHVVPHLDRVGGTERQALTLARLQRRHAAMAPILLTHGAEGLPEFEKGAFGEIHRLPRGLLRHHPGSWWRRHRERIDVVHAHGFHKLTGQVVSLARDAGIPTLVKVATQGDVRMFAAPEAWEEPLDGDDRPPGGWRWRRGVRVAFRRLRRADLFAALSDAIAAELAEQGLPLVRVPNLVDEQHFRPPTADERSAARTALGLGDSTGCRPFVVACVSRLVQRKDVACLLDAFALWLSSLGTGDRGSTAVDPLLVVAGNGPLREALEEQARALGLMATAGSDALPSAADSCDTMPPTRGAGSASASASASGSGPAPAPAPAPTASARVRFLGELADVRPLLFAADLLVHPSRREGQPNVVLEARACGLPVVLSDIAGHAALAAAATDARHTSVAHQAVGATAPTATFRVGDAPSLAGLLDRLASDRS